MSELAPINEKDVSLFNLKTELVQLMHLRDDETLTPEERAAVDGQVRAYVEANLRKIDNVASFIRHRRVMAKAAKDEAQRLAKLSASYEAEEEYVLGMCKDLMIQFGERKLEGERGSISLQKNCGNVALEITNPSLIPEELVRYVGVITSRAWNQIKEFGLAFAEDFAEYEGVLLERQPLVEAVRQALHLGPVAGARLQDRGEHVRIK